MNPSWIRQQSGRMWFLLPETLVMFQDQRTHQKQRFLSEQFYQTDAITSIDTVTLNTGIFSTGSSNDTSFVFSTIEDIQGKIKEDGVGNWLHILIIFPFIKEHYLKKNFLYDGSLDQKFILDNANIDTSTISVYVSESGLKKDFKYVPVENILM